MKAVLARQNYAVIFLLVVLVVAISAPVYIYRIMTPTDNDYGTHIQFALDMLNHQPVPSYTLAHPVMQILLIGILWVSRGKIGLWVGTILIQVVAQLAAALILYFWFGQLPGRWGDARRAFWALTLTIAAPVMALVFLDGRYYFGYIGLASYHNPTIHLLRPLALVSFMFAVRTFQGPRSPLWMVLVSAVVIVLSALIKPNYALIILPAMALLAALRLLIRPAGGRSFGDTYGEGFIDWRMILAGFIIPACAVLAGQALVTYGEGGSIIFSPFTVEAAYSSYLPVKFLLSFIFPLVVLAVYFPAMRKNPEMFLAWAAFAAGVLQMYLLAEQGDRLEHGNFRWGAQIGLFLLFCATARFFLRCTSPETNPSLKSRLFVAASYVPHVAAGVIYYIHALTSQGYG